MFHSLADFAPEGVEAGVGLALQDAAGRYLFFLAGSKHHCPDGELFYAGIGGHREPGESWESCARREVREEIGTGLMISTAPATWYLPSVGKAQKLKLIDRPRPLALYDMIHPPGTPKAGKIYRLVIFQGRLIQPPKSVRQEEVSAVIALTRVQVNQGPSRKPTLERLLLEGASMVLEPEIVDRQTRIYPLGTAVALSRLLGLEHG